MNNTIDQDLIDDATKYNRVEFERWYRGLYPRVLSETEFQIAIDAWQASAQLQRERQASEPAPSQSVDEIDYKTDIALREANHIHESDSYFTNRKFMLIDNVSNRNLFENGFQRGWQARANLTKPQPTPSQDVLGVDTIGLIASREMLKVITNHGIEIFEDRKSQLQAKIQCAVIEAIEAAIRKD